MSKRLEREQQTEISARLRTASRQRETETYHRITPTPIWKDSLCDLGSHKVVDDERGRDETSDETADSSQPKSSVQER